MNNWICNGLEVDEVPEGAKAFVYRIDIDGKYYIGKKQFHKSIKRPPLKGYKRHRRDSIESNWKKYCSSSEDVKQLVLDGHEPTRTILYLCDNLKEATYRENKLLYQCITAPDCLNRNIQGKFFKPEIEEWEKSS